jgi:transposase InsO family protein
LAHASEQDRPDILRRRWDWFEGQPDLDPDRLVFINETWASTRMARTHGRAPRGERLRSPVPHGHWRTGTGGRALEAGHWKTGTIAAFRRHTLLPLDDCRYALQATLPQLTRSALHRCPQRHGISRLPEIEGNRPTKTAFKAYPIGFFDIDIAEVQTAEGKLYRLVAIDRTSKFAFVQLVESATRVTASAFLEALVAAVPYRIHTILTENGIHARFAPRYANGPTARYMTHMSAMRCHEHGIEHRFTKINHPWTNGQVERMNRTIKHATVKRFHDDNHDQLRRHLVDFVAAYKFGRRLKHIRGLTPYEFTCKASVVLQSMGQRA